MNFKPQKSLICCFFGVGTDFLKVNISLGLLKQFGYCHINHKGLMNNQGDCLAPFPSLSESNVIITHHSNRQ